MLCSVPNSTGAPCYLQIKDNNACAGNHQVLAAKHRGILQHRSLKHGQSHPQQALKGWTQTAHTTPRPCQQTERSAGASTPHTSGGRCLLCNTATQLRWVTWRAVKKEEVRHAQQQQQQQQYQVSHALGYTDLRVCTASAIQWVSPFHPHVRFALSQLQTGTSHLACASSRLYDNCTPLPRVDTPPAVVTTRDPSEDFHCQITHSYAPAQHHMCPITPLR